MKHYNQITPSYLALLEQKSRDIRISLEILDEYENVIGTITKDISITAQGQININLNQIVRRSCSLTLINVDGRYTPSQDSEFWFDRKFKLWLGVVGKTDEYWFSQGVFVTKLAVGDNHEMRIEAEDKGSVLNGTVGTNMLETTYLVETGAVLSQFIKDTLMLSDGAVPMDSTPPLIDTYFDNVKVESEIKVNENEYISSIFTAIAEGYGANIYYNTDGRLVLEKGVESQLGFYERKPSIYHFKDGSAKYMQSSITYAFTGYNAVTVYTNSTEKDAEGNQLPNVRYTAYNRNPKSPLSIDKIKLRRMESQEVKFINGFTEEQMTQRCKEYAEYLLMKTSLNALSIEFYSTIMPHFDVDKVIDITDKVHKLDSERFVINSITIPLSADLMEINAVRITELPMDERM